LSDEQKQVSLKDLVVAGLEQTHLEDLVSELEEQLKQAKDKLCLQSTMILPNMMAEVGLESFTLPGGRKISIENKVYAKLPADTYNAFSWLREHGMDGVIKTQVVLDFGTGEDDKVHAAQDALMAMGLVPMVKSTIHHMTLKALVKEQLEKGTGIPLDDFGAGTIRTSVVKG
jgi:hypothetical protein